jgi:hypothetical protein
MPRRKSGKALRAANLSGKEVARLVIQDNIEQDHGRPRILTDADAVAIVNKLSSPEDIEEYNRWIKTHRLIAYISVSGLLGAEEVKTSIWRLLFHIKGQQSLVQLQNLVNRGLPRIVTQAQYEREMQVQKEEKLKLSLRLTDVFKLLLWDESPPEVRSHYGSPEELMRNPFGEPRHNPGSLAEAVSGQKGRTVEIGGTQPAQTVSVTATVTIPDRVRGIYYRVVEEWVKRLAAREIPLTASKKALTDLDRLGSLPQEDWEQDAWGKLGTVRVKVSDLYDQGYLREWVEERTTPNLVLFDPSYKGPVFPQSYAILQRPSSGLLDDEGNYLPITERPEDMARQTPAIAIHQDIKEEVEEPLVMGPLVQKIRDGIKHFLSVKTVVYYASEILGVDMGEELKEAWRELQTVDLRFLNLTIDEAHTERMILDQEQRTMNVVLRHFSQGQNLPGGPAEWKGEELLQQLPFEIEPIDPEKLLPTAKAIEEVKEQIALGLGDGWWEEWKRTTAAGEGADG